MQIHSLNTHITYAHKMLSSHTRTIINGLIKCHANTEIPTIIDPVALGYFLVALGSIIVGISVLAATAAPMRAVAVYVKSLCMAYLKKCHANTCRYGANYARSCCVVRVGEAWPCWVMITRVNIIHIHAHTCCVARVGEAWPCWVLNNPVDTIHIYLKLFPF